QRQHAVVLPQRLVLPQVHLGVVARLGGVPLHAQALQGEPEGGRVELHAHVGERAPHRGRVAVGARGGLGEALLVAALPADEELLHRLVRSGLLKAAGEGGGEQGEYERGAHGPGAPPPPPATARPYGCAWQVRPVRHGHAPRRRTAYDMARAISRFACFSARSRRLSYSFLPRATPISTFARPSLK